MVESDIDKIGQVVKAKTMSLQRASSALALRGLAEIAKLDTDPLVSRLIGIIRESESWQERSDAWEKIRKLGPQHGGWERSLKNLIYSSDGWGRIFASESLSWHRCAPEDATPVLIATLEAALENNRNDWARVGCGAIGKY
ncbi:hypothetical protein GTO27_03870, partial [Candidatus Bathyarchaeota archaeon]|nr:hypothetical protein [Candidatus Bathyarchaeota archaeon]